MLKGIIIFFKVLTLSNPKPTNVFTQQLGGDCTKADQQQWNGGRYLSFNEIQVAQLADCNLKGLEKHVS